MVSLWSIGIPSIFWANAFAPITTPRTPVNRVAFELPIPRLHLAKGRFRQKIAEKTSWFDFYAGRNSARAERLQKMLVTTECDSRIEVEFIILGDRCQ